MAELSWKSVVARRMARHCLQVPAAGGAADVVRAMCGAHAQVLSAGEESVALRLEQGTRADVQRALWEERTLVKAFGPRGTVHLLPTEDLPMWTGALSALPWMGPQMALDLRLTPEQEDEIVAAISTALADDDLTVDELGERIVALTGPWAGELVMEAFQTRWARWRIAVPTAALAGVLCYGPNRGRKTTYAHPRRWLPGFEPQDGDKALVELLHRYLYSYGPATPRQVARWLATAPGFIIDLFARSGLEEVVLDGRPAWIVEGDTAMPAEPAGGVRLIPYFDAYGVGSYPRELLFPGKAQTRALAGGQAGNFPLVLVDGIVAGVWHQRLAGRKVTVTVETVADLKRQQLRALDDEVERLGVILDAKPTLVVGEVTVGPHA